MTVPVASNATLTADARGYRVMTLGSEAGRRLAATTRPSSMAAAMRRPLGSMATAQTCAPADQSSSVRPAASRTSTRPRVESAAPVTTTRRSGVAAAEAIGPPAAGRPATVPPLGSQMRVAPFRSTIVTRPSAPNRCPPMFVRAAIGSVASTLRAQSQEAAVPSSPPLTSRPPGAKPTAVTAPLCPWSSASRAPRRASKTWAPENAATASRRPSPEKPTSLAPGADRGRK